MIRHRALVSFAAILLTAGAAMAQTAAPARSTAAPTATPLVKPMPATPATATPTTMSPPVAAATAPTDKTVNLNTATAAQLDALPTVGKARTKVIMTERAKSPFKDWADFDRRTAGTSVNAGVKAKIKPMATF